MKIAVTGAFSYSGKYITKRLLARGEEVVTLTGHPNRPDPFQISHHQIGIDHRADDQIRPFDDPIRPFEDATRQI